MLFCVTDKDLNFFCFFFDEASNILPYHYKPKDENDGKMKHFIFIVSTCPVH